MNKLGGFGPIYVINLPRRTDRREHMEKLFKDYDITNYTFIDAFDGKENIHQYMHEGAKKNDRAAKRTETAACMSHLKAIKHFGLETSKLIAVEDSQIGFNSCKAAKLDYVEFNYLVVDKSIDNIKERLKC